MYDIIGDIHGEIGALERLLRHLDYRHVDWTWRHPERKALFLGDLIDRGPRSREVVATVRAMAEAEQAQCIMGNHEFNAIAYHTPHPERPGEYLRAHSDKNYGQHAATLVSYEGHEAALASDLAWFRRLPFWLGLDELRLVHAAWLPEQMAVVKEALADRGPDWPEQHTDAFDEHTALGGALERVLKGVEHPLPEGVSFHDKDGNKRTRARIRWWESRPGVSWRSLALDPEGLPDHVLDKPTDDSVPNLEYPPEAPKVFVGHYWLSGTPEPLADNVICLDYSVAKGGKLVGCRWEDPDRSETGGFKWVENG